MSRRWAAARDLVAVLAGLVFFFVAWCVGR